MADPVNFTRPAAERISRVVRQVEAGDRSGSALEWDRPWDSFPARVTLRMCTFTGTWNKNTSKTVTFKYVANTPNTAAVSNLFANVEIATSVTAARNCAIAREGTAWFLIAAECD